MPSILSMSSKTPDSSTKSEEKFDSKSDNEQMPSNEIGENQAQKTTLDGIDGIDSNLQTGKEKEVIIEKESREEKYRREQEEIAKWGKGLEQ
jgi:hypothetical protein